MGATAGRAVRLLCATPATRPQLLAGDGVPRAVRDGIAMPHAASAACIWGLASMPRAVPLALPLGPPLGEPAGRPDPVGDAIPDAFRHSWIFACSAGSDPAPRPGNPPDCEAAGVDPANGELAVGVVGEADAGGGVEGTAGGVVGDADGGVVGEAGGGGGVEGTAGGVVGDADGGVVEAGRELAEPPQPATRLATARAATPSRAAAANVTVVLFT